MFAVLLLAALPSAEPAAADIVLKGGLLLDGTGSPGVVGDVVIRGDRIVRVGKVKAPAGAKIINCTGLVVAPGFIDLHSHSDTPLTEPATRNNLNFLWQGVTTVVTGNCGFGPVDTADYYKTLETHGVGTNVAHQVPHNAVREAVMGNVNRPPSEAELKQMADLVEKGMLDGAWGFATGLIYNPGTYAGTEEIIALARPAAKHGGIYASHIRNESAGLLPALEEALRVGREAGLPVHISHLKSSGRRHWGKAADAVALLTKARADGMKVTADQYPYASSSTSLRAMVVPARFREGDQKQFVARLDDPTTGPAVRAAIMESLADMQGGKDLHVARYKPNPMWQGLDLTAIASKEGQSVLQVVLEIERNGGASIVLDGMSEDDVRLIMKQPFVATASDGSAMVPSDTVPHPRSYGTFPRKIGRYSIGEKLLPLEQAVRSATGLPADVLGMTDRGYLKAGSFADVAVFDPAVFIDVATYKKPHQYAVGLRYLFVNGKAAIAESKFTDTLAGRPLRHRSAAK